MLFLRSKGPLQLALLNWQHHQGSKGLQTLLDGEMVLEYDLKPVARGGQYNPDSLTWVRTDTKGMLVSPWT